jgi:hypothetical protein
MLLFFEIMGIWPCSWSNLISIGQNDPQDFMASEQTLALFLL